MNNFLYKEKLYWGCKYATMLPVAQQILITEFLKQHAFFI